MEAWVEKFLAFMRESKKASNNTLVSYHGDLKRFCEYLCAQGLEVQAVSQADLSGYVEYLLRQNKSEASITRALVSIRCFYQYLVSQGQAEFNPAKGFSIPQHRGKLPEILTDREIGRILEQPDPRTFKGCRDRAILEVLYATGMKATEIISLNVSDVRLDIAMVHCAGEGNAARERMIPIYPQAAKCLAEYIKRGRALGVVEEALFVNLNGQRLTRQGFWKIVKQYTQQAGIEKDITPYTIRHSFAAQLLENGADLKSVQELLGHMDISSTQMYAKLVKNKYKAMYSKCHPRAI